MAKPEREFSADVGQKSMGVAGPDYIEKDFDKAFAMFDPNKNLPDGTPGGIGKENMQPGAVDDDVIGNREVDDTQAPTGNIGKYSNFLNWFAYMIKSITGKANWRTKPSYTIEQLGNSTIDGVKNIGGDIDFVAGTGMEITPDVAGKKITFAAKNDTIIPGPHAETHSSIGSDPITPESIGAETPAGAQAMVDTHENKTSTHGATAAATPNRIMMRAANGTAKVAAPVEEDDIARKAEVDYVRNYVESIHHVSLPLGNHYSNTIDPGKYKAIWHVPWKIPAGKTLYLDRAAYHFNNSPHLRLHICSYRSTPLQLLWSSPNASDDLWVGLPLIPPEPTDYITVGIYNSSSEYSLSFDSTSGIWLQFSIV